MRNIVHIDLNAFFAQCEENRDPSLKGKPVAVGGRSKRSVVSTANYEARKYGVHSALSMYEAMKICKNLVVVDSHYDLYSTVSKSFMKFLVQRFGYIEQVSIDECYIDVTDYMNDDDAYDKLLDLQLDIYKKLNLKCSIGYAHTKFLAKMASDLRKPLGLTFIITKEELEELIWPLSIDKMWGIGRKTAPLLLQNGIKTIGDLANSKDYKTRTILGSMYDTFIGWANGRGNDIVQKERGDSKSISMSRTLSSDETDYELLQNKLLDLCKDVVYELKRSERACKTLVVTYRTDDFITKSKRSSFALATDSLEMISEETLLVFEKFYKNEPVRLLGVGVENFVPKEKEEQLSLFKEERKSSNTRQNDLEKLKKELNIENLTTLKDYLEEEKNEDK